MGMLGISRTDIEKMHAQFNLEEIFVDNRQAETISGEKIESLEDLVKVKEIELAGGVQLTLRGINLQEREIGAKERRR